MGRPDSIYPLLIEGGTALIGNELVQAPVAMTGGRISLEPAAAARRLDAAGLFVLPGLVDIHGDAFERQIMPRPGVSFDLALALAETDRQLAANGITTAFHGLTWSWEPGLRGPESARAFVAAVEGMRPHLACDTRIHLRHEVFNVDAVDEIIGWIISRRIDVIAFNDHMTSIARDRRKPAKLAKMVERSGLSAAAFDALIERTLARAGEVPSAIDRLAREARTHGLALMSHDDPTPEARRHFRALGCAIAEFPTTVAAAEEARDANEWSVFGAPNVLRGGSHTDCPSARDMVEQGLCSVLASDYYYPSLLQAPFVLDAEGIAPLAEAWPLVSEHPAAAVGLEDRGQLNPGMRADIVLVDATGPNPRVVATLVAGRIVHLSEAGRFGS